MARASARSPKPGTGTLPHPDPGRDPLDQDLVLGRYRLQRRLGAGSFGIVWSAWDERLEREVALKMIPRERVGEARFVHEARAAARLSHAGIVTLYEAAADDAGAYLVSELVRGPTLAGLLAEGRLSDHDLACMGIALCDALEHAHSLGIVHRDLKPANILVPDDPSRHPVKLTDFGVARVLGSDELTRGDVVGTAAYMAPEQAAGRPVGPPADVYALALILYEALSAENPLRRLGPEDPRRRRLRFTPLRRLRGDLPEPLTAGVDRALSPRPADRGDLADLRVALATSAPRLDDRLADAATAVPRGQPSATWRPQQPMGRDEPPALAGSAGPDTAPPPRHLLRGPGRVGLLAALAAGVGVAWLTKHALRSDAFSPWLAGLLAGGASLLVPRLLWLCAATALAATAVFEHRAGTGMVLLLVFAIPAALMPLRARSWPIALLAPLLGLLGLAGAWPALAGQARGPFRRAGLGAGGWLLIVVLGALRHPPGIYVPEPHGVLAAARWSGSIDAAWAGMIRPLATSGVLAGAAVWAVAALVLPWLVRGRSLAGDALMALVWTTATLAALEAALGGALRGREWTGSAEAMLGAVAAGLLALAPAVMRSWRTVRHEQDVP